MDRMRNMLQLQIQRRSWHEAKSALETVLKFREELMKSVLFHGQKVGRNTQTKATGMVASRKEVLLRSSKYLILIRRGKRRVHGNGYIIPMHLLVLEVKNESQLANDGIITGVLGG